MHNELTPGPWYDIVRFANNQGEPGRTLRGRALLRSGECVGMEERLFTSDGKLVPLNDGRTSLADRVP